MVWLERLPEVIAGVHPCDGAVIGWGVVCDQLAKEGTHDHGNRVNLEGFLPRNPLIMKRYRRWDSNPHILADNGF